MSIDLSSLGAIPVPVNPYKDAGTALGAAARGALGMVPVGEQAYAGASSLLDNTSYLEARRALADQVKKDIDMHPGARLAGQVAGVAAPIIATAGLAAPESLAAAAGQGALYGGAFGAGNAIDDVAAGGGAGDAVKDLAVGAGVGALGGGLGHAATDLLKGLGGKAVVNGLQDIEKGEPVPQALLPKAEPAPLSADNLVSMTSKPELPGAAHLPSEPPVPTPEPTIPAPEAPPVPPTPEMPPLAVQAKQGFSPNESEMKAEVLMGVLGGTPGQMRKLPGKDMVGTINRMGDVIRANSTKDNPLVSMGDRYADRLNKFVAWQEKSGKVIGDTIDKANVAPLNIQPIKEALRGAMEFPGLEDKAVLDQVAASLDKYAKMDKTPGSLSFQRLHDLKGRIGQEAFEGKGSKPLMAAYHVISDLQDAELDKAGSLVNKPAFTAAKEAYQVASRAIPMLRTATARSLAKGYHSFGTPLAALVTGHPLDALKHVLEEPVKRAVSAAAFNAPSMGVSAGAAPARAATSVASKVAEAVAPTDLHLQHPAMAPWKATFEKNAANAKDPAEVAKSHATTDFVLSQRDPAYAKAKQEAADAVAKAPEAKEEPPKMAAGGVVPEPSMFDQIKNKISSIGPVEGFGSTLDGFQKAVTPQPPVVDTLPVANANNPTFGQPFNPGMADKLREYMEFMKKEKEVSE